MPGATGGGGLGNGGLGGGGGGGELGGGWSMQQPCPGSFSCVPCCGIGHRPAPRARSAAAR